MINIRAFLKRNGFKKMEQNHYANDICGVVFEEDSITVADNEGNQTFAFACNFYWLVGFLTYHNYLPQNYKK